MAIQRYNRPVSNLLESEFDRLFDRLTRSNLFPETEGERLNVRPAIDLTEKDDEYLLEAELPGIDEDDFSISFQNNVLTLKGQKEYTDEDKSEERYHRERMFGSFERSIRFDTEIDADDIEAEYENGVLSIRLPKTEKSMHKEIPVNFKK